MKIYKDNITIVKNAGEYMMVYVQARSIQKRVLHWGKDTKGKWTPFEIEWEGWFAEISRPVKNYPTYNPNLRFVRRYDIPRFFLFCDMAGIELRCRMLRQGKFTDDEWKLINEHCKKVEWEDKREEISLPNKTIPTKDEILYLLNKSTMLDSDARKYQNECCEEYLEYYETYKTKEDQDKIDRELKEKLKYIKNF